MQPTTVVHDRHVFMLLGNYSRTMSEAEVPGKDSWKLLLVKGTVSGSDHGKKIQWDETHAVQPESVAAHNSLTRLVGGGGSGVVLRDGSLVFPMQATNKNGKDVFLSMHLIRGGSKWELRRQMTEVEDCRDPSMVEWGDDKNFLMMAPCKEGYYDVYKLQGDARSWYSDGEPISRVWGTSHDRKKEGVRSGFITAELEGTKVMFLTTPMYSKEEEGTAKGKGRLHLWVT
ncbi:trans-sialidase, partial [Trypanosoma rangeli SC58]